ncbi:hypothetical protein BJ508DRAFT_308252 [Ascobolus immersus RN42]|uniref:Uncharacterized protein n=1 Tax=Ascobolus immersus RN42 TaxID=1160509 RepID=A0A3N4I067_ASCIM|nr:hypothetical protein BJ508DRAFT_308252 [Ascobolus immersus RN42]
MDAFSLQSTPTQQQQSPMADSSHENSKMFSELLPSQRVCALNHNKDSSSQDEPAKVLEPDRLESACSLDCGNSGKPTEANGKEQEGEENESGLPAMESHSKPEVPIDSSCSCPDCSLDFGALHDSKILCVGDAYDAFVLNHLDYIIKFGKYHEILFQFPIINVYRSSDLQFYCIIRGCDFASSDALLFKQHCCFDHCCPNFVRPLYGCSRYMDITGRPIYDLAVALPHDDIDKNGCFVHHPFIAGRLGAVLLPSSQPSSPPSYNEASPPNPDSVSPQVSDSSAADSASSIEPPSPATDATSRTADCSKATTKASDKIDERRDALKAERQNRKRLFEEALEALRVEIDNAKACAARKGE